MDIDKLIYEGMTEKTPSDCGDLIIAQPLMKERWFARTVILMLDRDDKGGRLGLMLNQQLPISLGELMPDWPEALKLPVFAGGPVEKDRLFLLHTVGKEFGDCLEVLPGLYVGGDYDLVKEYIDTHGDLEGKLRFMVGYSGWSQGQLEEEIAGRTWAIAHPVTGRDLLTGSGEDMWRREVERLGEDYRAWLSVPRDPKMN